MEVLGPWAGDQSKVCDPYSNCGDGGLASGTSFGYLDEIRAAPGGLLVIDKLSNRIRFLPFDITVQNQRKSGRSTPPVETVAGSGFPCLVTEDDYSLKDSCD